MSAQQQIYRTSPERMGRMMAIMVGICVVGGAIFFGMWDYWISMPAPVVAGSAGDAVPAPPPPAASGTEIRVDLDFVESDDFLTLGFNGLPGEEGANPEIRVRSGDTITVRSTNTGVSFHSFGVVTDPEDFNSVVWDSAIASATAPLRGGESGEVTFVAGAPGLYHYICTVPGHSLQGMQGTFVVE